MMKDVYLNMKILYVKEEKLDNKTVKSYKLKILDNNNKDFTSLKPFYSNIP